MRAWKREWGREKIVGTFSSWYKEIKLLWWGTVVFLSTDINSIKTVSPPSPTKNIPVLRTLLVHHFTLAAARECWGLGWGINLPRGFKILLKINQDHLKTSWWLLICSPLHLVSRPNCLVWPGDELVLWIVLCLDYFAVANLNICSGNCPSFRACFVLCGAVKPEKP